MELVAFRKEKKVNIFTISLLCLCPILSHRNIDDDGWYLLLYFGISI